MSGTARTAVCIERLPAERPVASGPLPAARCTRTFNPNRAARSAALVTAAISAVSAVVRGVRATHDSGGTCGDDNRGRVR
eukprot:IDg15384t1